MLNRQYFAHGSVVGRALAHGARGPVFGEDLAWGTDVTAQWVVTQWLASPGHRAVLLRPGFRRVGIGIAFGTFAGRGGAAVASPALQSDAREARAKLFGGHQRAEL